MRTLQDLFEHEVQDLYYAKEQPVEALAKMAKAASHALKKAFETYLQETKEQVRRLEQACELLDIKPGSMKCAMEGLSS